MRERMSCRKMRKLMRLPVEPLRRKIRPGGALHKVILSQCLEAIKQERQGRVPGQLDGVQERQLLLHVLDTDDSLDVDEVFGLIERAKQPAGQGAAIQRSRGG